MQGIVWIKNKVVFYSWSMSTPKLQGWNLVVVVVVAIAVAVPVAFASSPLRCHSHGRCCRCDKIRPSRMATPGCHCDHWWLISVAVPSTDVWKRRASVSPGGYNLDMQWHERKWVWEQSHLPEAPADVVPCCPLPSMFRLVDWCRRLRRIFRSREWATHAWYRSDPTWTWNQLWGSEGWKSCLLCAKDRLTTRHKIEFVLIYTILLTQLAGMHRFWMHHYDQSCMWCDVCWILSFGLALFSATCSWVFKVPFLNLSARSLSIPSKRVSPCWWRTCPSTSMRCCNRWPCREWVGIAWCT